MVPDTKYLSQNMRKGLIGSKVANIETAGRDQPILSLELSALHCHIQLTHASRYKIHIYDMHFVCLTLAFYCPERLQLLLKFVRATKSAPHTNMDRYHPVKQKSSQNLHESIPYIARIDIVRGGRFSNSVFDNILMKL